LIAHPHNNTANKTALNFKQKFFFFIILLIVVGNFFLIAFSFRPIRKFDVANDQDLMTLQLAEIKTRLTTFEKQPLSSEGLYELQKSLRFLALALAAYPLYENETMSTGDYSTNANIIQIKQDIL